MKKILLLITLFFMVSVKADISLDCDNLNVKSKEEFVCYIKSSEEITYLEGTLEYKHAGFLKFNRSVNFKDNNFRFPSFKLEVQDGSSKILGNIRSVSKSDYDVTMSLKNLKYKTAPTGKLKTSKDITVKLNEKRPVPTTKKVSNFDVTFNYEKEKIVKTCSTEGLTCKINLKELNIPVKEDYTFKGWGNEKSCTDGSTDSYTASKNISLYPCLVKNNYDRTLLLDNIKIENKEINFDKNTFSYDIEVLNTVDKLKVKLSHADDIEIMFNNKELKEGTNILNIYLKKDDILNKYTLNVTKLKPGENLTSASLVKNIIIKDTDFKFIKNKYSYDLIIPNSFKQLDIELILEDDQSTFQVAGNEKLKDGSKVLITVSNASEDEVYKINIVKETDKMKIYAMIGLLILLLFLILTVIYINTKKKKKTSKNNKNNKSKKNKKTEKIESLDDPEKEVEVLETL